jgi:hypothetical protein
MRLGILVEGVEEVEGGLERFREVELVSRRLGGEGVEGVEVVEGISLVFQLLLGVEIITYSP